MEGSELTADHWHKFKKPDSSRKCEFTVNRFTLIFKAFRTFLFHPIVVRKDTWNYFNLFKFVKTWLWPIMYPGGCCLCTWMYMCCCLVVCLNMSVRTIWSLHVFIKACLFIDFLSIFISGLLKSLTALVCNQFFL